MVELSLAVFVACMAWAAINDLRTMRIPNACVLALLAAFVCVVPFAPFGWAEVGDHVVAMLGTLVFCFCLFMFNKLGAGDGKLLAVVALWVGPSGLFPFAVYTALFGGGLAFIVLMMRSSLLPVRMATHPIVERLQGEDRSIPYAMAIAPAALLALTDSPWAASLPFLGAS